jgi:hypothetical protein
MSQETGGGMEPMRKKRRLFDEQVQGIEEINQHLAGKITLKTYTVERTPKPEVTPAPTTTANTEKGFTENP